jgi:hypothetical protein
MRRMARGHQIVFFDVERQRDDLRETPGHIGGIVRYRSDGVTRRLAREIETYLLAPDGGRQAFEPEEREWERWIGRREAAAQAIATLFKCDSSVADSGALCATTTVVVEHIGGSYFWTGRWHRMTMAAILDWHMVRGRSHEVDVIYPRQDLVLQLAQIDEECLLGALSIGHVGDWDD